ncbi:MAG: hypothetical protein JWR85_4196 [Marmoricola sp.]|nr:hypothetical protein [Marmoricola sp.]
MPNRDDETRAEAIRQAEGQSQETKNALVLYELTALRREIDELQSRVNTLTAEKEKALRWGIAALGTAVLGMATWIFNFVMGHIK